MGMNLFKNGVSQSGQTALRGFETEWTVDTDTEAGRTITLPLVDYGAFDCVIDWGDSSSSEVTAYDDADRAHEYASTGTYTVKITGDCPSWSFAGAGDCLKLTDIIYWGDSAVFSGFRWLSQGFEGCANLVSLGEGQIGVYAPGTPNFLSTFKNCSSITTIPEGIFDLNTQVVGCIGTFFGCSALETVPDLLFVNQIDVTLFGMVFANCVKLQFNPKTFYDTGDKDTRFLNQSIDFTQSFFRFGFTGTQGTVPNLWDCNYGSGSPITVNTFAGAGNDGTSISNYTDIPSAWGGPV